MCGRYANRLDDLDDWGDWADLHEAWPSRVETGYNVAPTRTVPVFVHDESATAGMRGMAMRWGLTPAWSKEAETRFATFNARCETLAEKPAFRGAWKQSRTCLAPALGYYEWQGEKGHKQPYFIRMADGSPLVMAGLWDLWRQDGRELYSCTLITQPAAGELADIHPRMPVMLERDQAAGWLADGANRLNLVLKRQHAERLEFYPVSRAVNKVENNGPGLLERREPAPPGDTAH